MVLFNRNPVKIGESIEPPSQDAIENSLNLRQVSLEDAARYRWLKSQPEFLKRTVEGTGLSVDEAIDLMRSRPTTH